MYMRERKPSLPLETLLARYAEMGGVIDYVLLDLNGRDGHVYETHRDTAIATMEVLSARIDHYFLTLLQHPDFQGCQREAYFRVTFDPARMRAHQISVQEFLGPMFDLETHRLLLRGRSHPHLNDYFGAGTQEHPLNIVPYPQRHSEYMTQGYAHAFSDPPYNLRGTAAEINAVFLQLSEALFQGFRMACHHWQWSTDWSNYFEAGHEWWGSFLWTVYVQGSASLVGVGASSTD
jgi:hypothetical protein